MRPKLHPFLSTPQILATAGEMQKYLTMLHCCRFHLTKSVVAEHCGSAIFAVRGLSPSLSFWYSKTCQHLGNSWRDAEVFDEVCRCRALWLCHFCSSRLESITIVLVQSDMSVVFLAPFCIMSSSLPLVRIEDDFANALFPN